MKRELNFENFYVYDGNKVAYLAAQKIIEFPGELFNPLYIYAGTGLGKTHLLCAIFTELNKKSTTLLFSAKDFEKYLEETKVFETPLIVDDLHSVSAKYHEIILGLVDALLANNKQICFSTNAAPKDLKHFEDKLISRFEGGLVCDILPPKEMALVDIIKKKSTEEGILLPDEVVLELAQLSAGSIRKIEGMINRLIAYSSLGNLSLDIDSVRMILKEFYPKGIYSPVSSLLEELKKNASEVLQGVTERFDAIEEYREKIYVWEMKGFDTSVLKPLLEINDIELLKKEYDNYIQKVEKLIELQKEFGSLNTSRCPDDAMKIESMLFSPDHVDEIKGLIAKVKEGTQVVEVQKAFDNFITGACNKTVLDIYEKQVLNNLGEKFNPFIVFGKKATGKTQFLEAVYSDLTSRGKSVKLIDLTNKKAVHESDDLGKYDVLLFDNFHQIFSLAAKLRKKFFDYIMDYIKSDKQIIIGSDTLPSDLSLSDDEKLVFEFAIETELKEPSPEVVEAYIKSNLELDKAEEIINRGLPQFASFGEIDKFLDSPKEKKLQELIPLGLPGEEVVEKEEMVAVKEVVEKSETTKSAEDKEIPFKDIKEDRLILQEMAGELVEDNY